MQSQIEVPCHIKDHPWQWMKFFGLIVKFAIPFQLHGHVMSFTTDSLMALIQGN